MKNQHIEYKTTQDRLIIKKCHTCGHLIETLNEPQKCQSCSQSFLPLNYFAKVHATNSEEFKKLFVHVDQLRDEDMIKGIMVIW